MYASSPLYVALLIGSCEDKAQLKIRLFSFIIHPQLFKIKDYAQGMRPRLPCSLPALPSVLHLDFAMVSAQPIHCSAACG